MQGSKPLSLFRKRYEVELHIFTLRRKNSLRFTQFTYNALTLEHDDVNILLYMSLLYGYIGGPNAWKNHA